MTVDDKAGRELAHAGMRIVGVEAKGGDSSKLRRDKKICRIVTYVKEEK